VRTSLGVVTASCALLLSGCLNAPMTNNTIESNTVRGTALKGIVHGGRQPIVGAHVYLLQANTGGYAGPGVAASTNNLSNSLLAGTGYSDSIGSYVLTNSSGVFNISGDYSCTPNSQVYLYALGGDAGAGANSAAGLLAALGNCPITDSFSSSLYIVVNEVSTIAMAYSVAGYATDALHVSSTGSALALTGIANAFATAANLETLGTGVALTTTPAGNGTAPQVMVDTLADILAACVNTTGPTSSGCATLLGDALSGGTAGTQPTETATAAINIAHNPWANIAALYGLQTASSPFQPTMSSTPNDFTVGIAYSSGGENIAIDASGNVWTTGVNSIGKYSPTGVPLTGSPFTGGGLDTPIAIAIDASGNAWITNQGGNYSLSEFSSTGTPISSSSGYTGGGLDVPLGIAIDASDDVWVGNVSGARLSEFNSSGTPISTSSGYTGGGLNTPDCIAVDTSGNVWAANYGEGANSVSKFSSTGTAISGSSGYTGGGLEAPMGIAIDASGNAWAADGSKGATIVAEISSSGTAMSGSGYAGGGLNGPWGIAVDGSGNVWTTDWDAGSGHSVSELNSSGTAISPSTGYQAGGLTTVLGISPQWIAIDGSGNVWVTPGPGELVGAATPVVTPIVANLKSPYGSHAVNRP